MSLLCPLLDVAKLAPHIAQPCSAAGHLGPERHSTGEARGHWLVVRRAHVHVGPVEVGRKALPWRRAPVHSAQVAQREGSRSQAQGPALTTSQLTGVNKMRSAHEGTVFPDVSYSSVPGTKRKVGSNSVRISIRLVNAGTARRLIDLRSRSLCSRRCTDWAHPSRQSRFVSGAV